MIVEGTHQGRFHLNDMKGLLPREGGFSSVRGVRNVRRNSFEIIQDLKKEPDFEK